MQEMLKNPDYIVVRRTTTEDAPENSEYSEKSQDTIVELSHDKAAKIIMRVKGYKGYIEKHGYHFTDSLASWASKQMKNADKSSHSWTPKQVELAIAPYQKPTSLKHTIGDVTYLANMAYADFYPEVLKDETSCIKYALAVVSDPDGYEGMAFMRWIADVVAKEMTNIDWTKYM